ncbi:LURP-one-related/scramblase family protein [Amycolatopsis samaneae]|uniref:Scramblase n=1 Tax=Amycolatopsis samaneae TaxID=664691 RepID=A0ABW5GHR0_9PSEU
MEIHQFQKQDRFHIRQKQKLTITRYHVYADDGQGQPGDLVAFIEEKRVTFKENATFYTDESKETVLARFRAHKTEELSSSYQVLGEDEEEVLGLFGKKFGKSFYRSTWVLEQEGRDRLTVSERSKGMAAFRRIWKLVPWPGDVEVPFFWKYHFDFTRGEETERQVVGALEKTARLSDHYLLRLEDDQLDRRLALALAVGLDALQYN